LAKTKGEGAVVQSPLFGTPRHGKRTVLAAAVAAAAPMAAVARGIFKLPTVTNYWGARSGVTDLSRAALASGGWRWDSARSLRDVRADTILRSKNVPDGGRTIGYHQLLGGDRVGAKQQTNEAQVADVQPFELVLKFGRKCRERNGGINQSGNEALDLGRVAARTKLGRS
jgi:hypothetical protein